MNLTHTVLVHRTEPVGALSKSPWHPHSMATCLVLEHACYFLDVTWVDLIREAAQTVLNGILHRGSVRLSGCTVSVCGYPIFFFQAEDGIRDDLVTGVQTCALPIYTATTEIFTLPSLFACLLVSILSDRCQSLQYV